MDNLEVLTYGFALNPDQGAFGYSTNSLLTLGNNRILIDTGLSLGIYFQDPDGNGIEVYYETPRSEWPRQENLFLSGERPKGKLPGPWDEALLKGQAATG